MLQDLKECGKGNMGAIASRGISTCPNNTELLEQQRLASAALAEIRKSALRPEVTAPTVEQNLYREIERIRYESSSEDDDVISMASQWPDQDVPVTADPTRSPNDASFRSEEGEGDLSSDLNDLFNKPRKNPSRWQRGR